MSSNKARKQLHKSQDENIYMSPDNLKICNHNQDRYTTPQLNDAFQLHYYGFYDIANLQPYFNINTLYLNNNVIHKINGLQCLKKLVTLNLANNRITKIQNLQQLTQIVILDLAGNQIKKVQNIAHLSKLATFNISGNLLETPESIQELTQNKALTCLNISSNPLQDDIELYSYLQEIPLLTLYLKDTKFSRGIASYRKQTICHNKLLTFLDEKPVSKQERMMAEAWKEGGLQRQKQVRKLIAETKEEKNKKIYDEMMETNARVDKLRDTLFQKLTVPEHQQLQQLKTQHELCLKNQIQNQDDLLVLQIKIQQLQTFLKYFREDVNYMSVSEQLKVPNNLCERHESDAIYIYGVSQDQLPGIKQTYYPDDPRPLIAKDFQKPQQSRWVANYQQILEQTCNLYESEQMIVPAFNIKVHQFNFTNNRKAKRLSKEELHEKIEDCLGMKNNGYIKKSYEIDNELNDLD